MSHLPLLLFYLHLLSCLAKRQTSTDHEDILRKEARERRGFQENWLPRFEDITYIRNLDFSEDSDQLSDS